MAPVNTRTIGQYPFRSVLLSDDMFVLQAQTGEYYHTNLEDIVNSVSTLQNVPLNDIDIDVDKDWNGKKITNVSLSNIKNTKYNQSVLPFATSLIVNFDTEQHQTVTLTGDISTLATSNATAGALKTLVLIGDTVNRTITFNGAWKTFPSTATFEVTANSIAIMSFYSKGESESDIIVSINNFS